MAKMGAVVVALTVLLSGCVSGMAEPAPRVVVGVGSSTEQRVLAALAVYALDQAGLSPEVRADLGGTVELRREAIRGNIDLFWDYTGAAWALGLGHQAPPADPYESYERVRQGDQDNDLVWLKPTEANATLALFVRAEELPDGQPGTMTWLSRVLSGGEAPLCADQDFVERPGGLEVLASAYAIGERLRVLPADEEEAVAGVVDGRCFAGLASATSGEARAGGLLPVSDDLSVFPAFVVAPVVRAAALREMPDIGQALEPVAELLDTRSLAKLNADAETDAEVESERFAAEFLADVLPASDG